MKHLVEALFVACAGLVWWGAAAWLRNKRQRNRVFIAYFSVFFAYLAGVLYVTLIQFQSLLVLKLFMPELVLKGESASESVNLVPLAGLSSADAKTSLLNVLLLVPFGFGLAFLTALKLPGVTLAGAAFSVAIELAQWLTGLAAGVTFRVADVNDVLFNTVGAAVGYGMFVAIARCCGRKGWRLDGERRGPRSVAE